MENELKSMVKNKERARLYLYYTMEFARLTSAYEIVRSASGNHLIKVSTGEVIGRFPTYFEAMVYAVTLPRLKQFEEESDG